MDREFEGRTEQEAIDNAVRELGIQAEEIEVEILDSQKGGLFQMGKKVRIRVHLPDEEGNFPVDDDEETSEREDTGNQRLPGSANAETDFEHAVVDFIGTVTEMMGFPASVQIMYREEEKIGMRLDSDFSNILIGRKGKNLDALQLLANVVAGRIEDGSPKIVLDSEGYRARREESLIRLAHKVGDQVKRTRKSKLLEPMNPFERRLIHTTLNDIEDIGTESEGDGLYKQVRVFYRNNR